MNLQEKVEFIHKYLVNNLPKNAVQFFLICMYVWESVNMYVNIFLQVVIKK